MRHKFILIKTFLIAVLVASLSFTGCKEDYEIFTPQDTIPIPNVTPFIGNVNKVFQQNIEQNTQIYVINIDEPVQLQANEGTLFFFEPGLLVNANSEPVSGEVTVEIVEMYEQGDFLLFNKPTKSGTSLMETGSGFYINVTQNGESLSFVDGAMMNVFLPNPNVLPDKQFFVGDDSGTDFNWLPSEVEVTHTSMTDNTGAEVFGYAGAINQLNWVNCSRIVPEEEVTQLFIGMPPGFDETNTAIFIAFKDINATMDLYEAEPGVFVTDFIPVGSAITIVGILESAEDTYYAAFKETIIEQDHLESVIFLPTTLEEFRIAVNEL